MSKKFDPIEARLRQLGFHHRYVVIGRGGKRYMVWHAHPRRKIALESGAERPETKRRDEELGELGWRVYRFQRITLRWLETGAAGRPPRSDRGKARGKYRPRVKMGHSRTDAHKVL